MAKRSFEIQLKQLNDKKVKPQLPTLVCNTGGGSGVSGSDSGKIS